MLPTPAPIPPGNRTQLESSCEPRFFESLYRRPPIVEATRAQSHAADKQALEKLGLVARSDDELGAAATDIDDEGPLLYTRREMSDSEIDEPGLLHAGDDLDLVPENFLRGSQEAV